MSKVIKIAAIIVIIVVTVILGKSNMNASGVQIDENFANAISLNISQYNDSFAPKASFHKGTNASSMYDDRILSALDLKNTSNLIYEITMVRRIQYGVMVESKVKITKVLKDTRNLHKTGDEIYIFERCYSNGRTQIIADSPLLPMKSRQKYLVFLNEIQSYVNHERFNLSTLNYSIIPVKEIFRVVGISDEKHEELSLNNKTWGLDYKYAISFDSIHFLLNTLDLDKVKEQMNIDLANYYTEFGDNADIENANSILDRVTNAQYSLNYFENYKKITREILKEYYGFDTKFSEVTYGD